MSDINTLKKGDENSETRQGKVVENSKDTISKNLEAQQELEDYRKEWEKQITRSITEDRKEKIIKAAEKIQVNVEKDHDGGRITKFKLGNKTYKFLDPKLKGHSDDEYFRDRKIKNVTERDERILAGSIDGEIDERLNQKLKEYIKEKQKEGRHIAGIEEIEKLLKELGEEGKLIYEEEQIAMLMYLIGIDGVYGLSLRNGTTNGYKIICEPYCRRFAGGSAYDEMSLLMAEIKQK